MTVLGLNISSVFYELQEFRLKIYLISLRLGFFLNKNSCIVSHFVVSEKGGRSRAPVARKEVHCVQRV